jgi:hypothetical protein
MLDEKKLDQLKAYKVLLTLFKTMELIQWSSFQELYKTELLAHQGAKLRFRTFECICSRQQYTTDVEYSTDVEEFCAAFGGDKQDARFKDLHKRVIQHNVRVISTYYQNIRMPRLAQLLELSEDEAEKHVCDMVVAASLWCRIDRLQGVATFQQTKDPAEILNLWSNNISELMCKVDKTCHLIHKESMVHGVAAK